MTPIEKFWAKVEKSTTCWLWTGGKTQAGYGISRSIFQPNIAYVGQVSWEIHNGPVPADKRVDQTCGNRSCVRPDHLTLNPKVARAKPKLAKQPVVDMPPENVTKVILKKEKSGTGKLVAIIHGLRLYGGGSTKTDYGDYPYTYQALVTARVFRLPGRKLRVEVDQSTIPAHFPLSASYNESISEQAITCLKRRGVI